MPNQIIRLFNQQTANPVDVLYADNGDGTYSPIAAPTIEGTALASLLRTVNTNSADLVNVGAKGVMVFLNVTVASGTGGLTVRIQSKDPVSGQYNSLLIASAAVIATGTSVYILYPGGSSGGTQGVSGPLPRTWRISVTVGDASNYTYSVGYCLIP